MQVATIILAIYMIENWEKNSRHNAQCYYHLIYSYLLSTVYVNWIICCIRQTRVQTADIDQPAKFCILWAYSVEKSLPSALSGSILAEHASLKRSFNYGTSWIISFVTVGASVVRAFSFSTPSVLSHCHTKCNCRYTVLLPHRNTITALLWQFMAQVAYTWSAICHCVHELFAIYQ